ncbi:MAG: MlaD family protein [Candidatus Sericytochromatia bacterium]|nr:MlaD family protein [Candidatus Sericytochromatia bacterium]
MSQYRNEIMLGGFILLGVGLLAAMSIAVGGMNFREGVHVRARFSNATGLVKDAAVTVAGVQVGHVESLSVEHDKAVVGIFLRKDAGIREDVRASIRAKSLLGEKYLELQPRGRETPLLANGGLIEETRSTVEVDELLASLAPLVKEVNPKDVAALVRGLAQTVDGEQAALARVVRHAGTITEQLADVLQTHRGEIDKTVVHVASLAKQGDQFFKEKAPALGRTVTNLDEMSRSWNKETPGLAAKAQRITSQVDRLTRAVEPETVGKIAKEAARAMQKMPGLLEKADKLSEADARAFAEEVLLRTGIRVYLHPFGPQSVPSVPGTPAPLTP